MIWLDMDGVVADFDEQYFKLFGVRPTRWPDPETVDWKAVHDVPDFYATIPLMPGAHKLFRYVDELGFGTGFLTGVPRSISTCYEQKRKYIAERFGEVQVVGCPSREKYMHGKPGDVLIDDYLRYRVEWEDMGGIFIHHTSADESIRQLGEFVSCGTIGEDYTPH